MRSLSNISFQDKANEETHSHGKRDLEKGVGGKKLSDIRDEYADKKIEHVIILGATGKRDDHTLANIFTLLQYPSPLEINLYTNHGIFSVVQGEQNFDSFTGQQISLFSTDPNIEVTSNRLKYNLNSKKLTNLYYGSLNESVDDSFTLTLSHGRILVYQVFHDIKTH